MQCVSGNVFKRIFFRYVERSLANNDGELDLPINLGSIFRNHQVVIGAHQRSCGFKKNDRLGWNFCTSLLRVIAEIQADANDLARAENWRTETDIGRDFCRQARVVSQPR